MTYAVNGVDITQHLKEKKKLFERNIILLTLRMIIEFVYTLFEILPINTPTKIFLLEYFILEKKLFVINLQNTK